MTTHTYIQLGRLGDIIGILPILHSDFQKTGVKQRLMVAAEFAPLLEGVSYVERVVYDGPHYEIEKAVLKARETGEICCVQVNGPPDQVRKYTREPAGRTGASTASFQQEQWLIAGRLEQWWDNLPLVFDRRNTEREHELLRKHDLIKRGKQPKLILLALKSQSSPFPYVELLKELVTLKFGATHRILEVPEAERIYDLLAIYEKASLLIAIDSAPLHLAWACQKLPVFALTQDRPIPWNGASWRPNMAWYCRYHDWPKRAVEMMSGMEGLFHWELSFPSVQAWNCYDAGSISPLLHSSSLPITRGMCGRDTFYTMKEDTRHPYLVDVLRMAMQRVKDDGSRVNLSRPGVTPTNLIANIPASPCFSYRIDQDAFRPVVDLFCATKAWWKSVLTEIPDLVMNHDDLWSQCLWALFKSKGAADITGATSYSPQPTPAPHKKSTAHNLKLLTDYMAKVKIYSRYPKVSEQAEVVPLDTSKFPPFAYNPSIILHEGRLWMTARYHFAKDARTKLCIGMVKGGKLEYAQPLPIDGFSVEDARLFSFHKETWVSWVESKWEGGRIIDPKAVVKYACLELPHNDNPALRKWQVPRVYQPDFARNDFTHIQKNWVFFEGIHEELLCIYESWPKQMVFKFDGDKPVTQWNGDPARWDYGPIRGGCVVPYEDKFLRFFHSAVRYGNEHRYFIGALLMKQEPPFEIISTSKKPIIYGSELDDLKQSQRKSCHHFKANVAFPCGAIAHEDGWLLSVGVNDCACALVKVRKENLNL